MDKKSLAGFRAGEKVKITCVNCGPGLKNRLGELGLYDNSELEIIKNDGSGPIIVKILNSNIALGRGETKKIYGRKI